MRGMTSTVVTSSASAFIVEVFGHMEHISCRCYLFGGICNCVVLVRNDVYGVNVGCVCSLCRMSEHGVGCRALGRESLMYIRSVRAGV
jgi:hypothetical protein